MKEEHLNRLSLALGNDCKKLIRGAKFYEEKGAPGTPDEGKTLASFFAIDNMACSVEQAADMKDAGWIDNAGRLTPVGEMLRRYANQGEA